MAATIRKPTWREYRPASRYIEVPCVTKPNASGRSPARHDRQSRVAASRDRDGASGRRCARPEARCRPGGRPRGVGTSQRIVHVKGSAPQFEPAVAPAGAHTLGSLVYTLVLLWLAGAALRITVLAIPPVLPPLQHDLGLSQTGVGLLSSLPSLMFACVAIPGAAMIGRFGVVPTLLGGLVLTAVAGALRAVSPDALVLFATTVAMSAGIAVMQPALPPLVRNWAPRHIGLATAVYSNGMLGSEAISAALTIPFVLPLVGYSWRASLLFWSSPVILAAVLIALRQRRHATRGASATRAAHVRHRWWPDWTDPLTWKVGVVMGCASAIFFGVNAFLPGYLNDSGEGRFLNDALAALNGGQIPATLILLVYGQRLATRRLAYVFAGIFAALAVAALLVMHGAWVVLGAGVAGFCCAWVITLGLMVPPLLAMPDDVHLMAGAIFTIGYLLAVIMPIVGGASWDMTGVRDAAFVPFVACGIVMALVGMWLRFIPHSHPAQA